MPHKFVGTFETLASLLTEQGILGGWTVQGGKHVFFGARGGGVLNWVPDTGSVWCQGEPESELSRFLALPTVQNWSSPEIHSIFIVHGRDTSDVPILTDFLNALGCVSQVLAKSGGSGLTIIEALEKSICGPESVSFGIVLLTAEDYGYLRGKSHKTRRLRARQNVVFEMGMLMAKLGRSRVAMLWKEDIELPSDVSGVMYLAYDQDLIKDAGALLIRRFEDVGIRFSPERIRNALALGAKQESADTA